MADQRVRHVLGLSGGKDSAALAVYMRDRVPEMEYFFCDTGAELPETYEYLRRIDAYLGGDRITYLNSGRDFDHWLSVFRGTLPSPQMRWCTKNMRIKPLEAWIGDDPAVSYVAIRSDEPQREGYVSKRPNITVRYPFKEDGIDMDGVMKILADMGIDLPAYYEWRTRSGCYFCFFQRKAEWVGLAERHPELFRRAVEYEEKAEWESGGTPNRPYTWSQGETLHELLARKDEIMARHEAALKRAGERRKNAPLIDILGSALDEDDDTLPCQLCNL